MQVYIVYMGSSLRKNREELVSSHLEVLSSVLERYQMKYSNLRIYLYCYICSYLILLFLYLNAYSPSHAKQSLVYSYTYAFTGFAAVLSKEQATALSGTSDIHLTQEFFMISKTLARFLL